jgi:hypothetical protein
VKRPRFFIVGAPKCATTSLYQYLRAHPQIFMPDRVEMNFFGQDLVVANRPSLQAYLEHFAGAEEWQVVGEKSVNYLFSERAHWEIREFQPEARIIVMLRNPVDVMYSLHHQYLFSANEDIVDFEEALAAEEDRRRGIRIPAGAHNPSFLVYSEVVTFSPQVRRYLETFGKERVLVLLFDDLRDDPVSTYRQALDFLRVDASFITDFSIHNPTKRVPNVALRKYMKTHRGLSRGIHRVLPKAWVDRLRAALSVTQPQPPGALNPELRSKLLTRFVPEIEALGDLIGRDLGHWYGKSPSGVSRPAR